MGCKHVNIQFVLIHNKHIIKTLWKGVLWDFIIMNI